MPDIRLPKSESQSDESDDDLYKKLIIPKKIVPSRYARAMSNVKRLAEQSAVNSITSNEQINFWNWKTYTKLIEGIWFIISKQK